MKRHRPRHSRRPRPRTERDPLDSQRAPLGLLDLPSSALLDARSRHRRWRLHPTSRPPHAGGFVPVGLGVVAPPYIVPAAALELPRLQRAAQRLWEAHAGGDRALEVWWWRDGPRQGLEIPEDSFLADAFTEGTRLLWEGPRGERRWLEVVGRWGTHQRRTGAFLMRQ